jgi:hypothetical protein
LGRIQTEAPLFKNSSMKILNTLLGACLAASASQVLAQSALTDANLKAMTLVIEEGKKCVDGLLPQNTAPFANASPDMRAVLLTPPANLPSSAELRKLTDQQRTALADTSKTAISCRVHQDNLKFLFSDLAAKGAAINNDAAAKDMLAKVREAGAMVNKSLGAIAQANPDFLHFLYVHGQLK